jgi:TonB family protein
MPSPTPPPCAGADLPAAVAASPPPPAIPSSVRALNVSGVAAIRVDLDRDGNVTGAEIMQSVGDPSFDAIALQLAKEAHYTPAQHACKTIASTYVFRVRFYAW